MQRSVLNTYSLVMGRKLNSSYLKSTPGGAPWIPGQVFPGRTCNLRTLSIGNNHSAFATASALNPVKISSDNMAKSGAGATTNLLTPEGKVETLDDEVEGLQEGTTTKSQESGSVGGGRRRFRQNPMNLVMESALDIQIQNAKNVDKLFELSADPGLTLKGACHIIFRLGQLTQDKSFGLSPQVIQNDGRFQRICKLIQKGNHSQVPHSLLQAIRGLQYLGLTSDGHSLVQELENELKWAMRRCPVKFLARAIEILSSGKMKEESSTASSDLSKAFIGAQDPLQVAIQSLQRRWTEVSSGGEFLIIFKVVNHLSNETREKLEDRAVELVQEFHPLEMVKMFIALASQKRRPTPLLRALAFHLSKSTEKIPVKDLVELIYALNELTFADPVLMQKICIDLSTEIESIKNPSWISSLATSLGQMRYLHKELMGSLEEWMSKHVDELRPFDCACWLLASSVFNLNTIKQQDFFTKAKLKLSQESVTNPMEWLNIVHAWVILDQATPDLISSVLKPEFVKKIDSLNESNANARLKLLNVNAFATSGNLNSSYKGPQLTKEFVTKWSATAGGNDLHLSKVTLETLSNFLPPPKYLRSGVKTESGVFIDALCVLNEKTDPVPVDSSNTKGAIKVAIIVQGYPVMCLGLKVPTGNSVLSIKLLQNEGYHVITVPYTEFSPKEKILRRVQYLEQKVRNVKNVKESNSSPNR